MYAMSIRGAVRPTAIGVGVTTFVAWGVSFFLFTYFTDAGRTSLEASGFPARFGGWIALSALIAAGHSLGYVVLRSLVPGTKAFSERRVARLAFGDSVATMAGGYALGFIPLTLFPDPIVMLGWGVVVGLLFSFVAINPGYVARFRRAVENGEVVRDQLA